MKKVYSAIIVLCIIILTIAVCSCKKIFHIDDKLSLERQDYSGNQLRIDGYYSCKFGNLYRIYFLYSDGTVLSGGDVFEDKLQEQEQKYIDGSFFASKKENKLYWGVFNIDIKIIKIEKWYPSSGGGMPVYLHKGEIQNDTTFLITKSIHSKTGKEKDLNETYHFRQFSPKPDSTNTFIK